MNSFQILTSRTKLRLININDLIAIHALHSIPETDEFNTLGIPDDIKETKAHIKSWVAQNKVTDRSNYTMAIEDKKSGELIGLFGFRLWPSKHKRGEVWYKINPQFWNQGIATEVLIAVLDFGFDTLNLHRIQAGCAVHNLGSIKVLEKAGMIREGTGRQVLPLKSGWSDNFEYSILETDERKVST
jgi:ribosomal-protein-alanine N-acetyltransferase